MNTHCSEADRVVPNAISAPPAFSLRRAFAAVCALLVATVAQATPTISITSPTTGSSINAAATPTITINATTAIGSSPSGTQVSRVEFFVNSVSIGTVGGGAFGVYSTTWTPASTGSYTLTAVVTDTSTVTTGTSPNLNTATSPLVLVTVTSTETTVSLTNPANASSLGLGAAVNLTANATAPAGATLSRVDFLSGATVLGSSFTAPYSFSWTPAAAGSASLTARVTDSNSFTATSTAVVVTITVPSVSLTSPSTGAGVALGAVVPITAAATAVSPATIAKVDFLVGTALVGTATAAPYTINWTPTATGAAALTSRVTDSNGATITSSAVNVTVAAGVPTVSLTAPTNGSSLTLGTAATLSATAVASSGTTVARVDFLSGTTVVGTALAPTAGSNYSVAWTPTAAGISSLTARVTDSNGTAVTSSIVNVNVAAAAAPTISLTAPLTGAVVTAGSNVTLTATAAPGAGATVAQVQFLVGTTIVGTVTTAPYSTTWIPSASGNFALTARVTDSSGAAITSSTVNVTVAAAGVPTVSLTAPTNGASLTLGTAATLSATAAASSGTSVTRVDFLSGTTVVGTALAPTTGSTYSFSWTPTAAGITSLTARVTDSNGTAVASSIVNVNVVAAAAPTISLTAPLTGAVVTAGSNVTLTASAAAGAGATVAQVQFLVGTTIVGTVTTAPYSTTWIPSAAGNFTLTARVTDSNGAAITSSAVNVTVAAAGVPTVSLTAPTNGASLTLGTAATLSATAAASSGTTVTRVDFLSGSTVVGTALSPTSGSNYSVAWTPTAAGISSLTARVTDSSGTAVTSSIVNVNVVAAAAPTISLTAPSMGAVVTAGSNVTLTATAAPGAGATVAQVQFLVGTTVLSTVSTAPYTATWTPPAAGNFSLTARVTDSTGAVVTSSAVSVTAAAAAVTTVAISSPVNNATATVGTSVTVTASASASTGATISSVAFFANGVAIGAPVTTAPYSIAWTPTVAGTIQLTARATDSLTVAATSSIVNVVVSDTTAPALTVALSPGVAPGTTLPAGATRFVLATTQAAAGRAIVGVEFYIDGIKVGEMTTAPYVYKYVAPAATGLYLLTVRSIDNAGFFRDVSQTLTVVSAVGRPPTSTLITPTNGSVAIPGTAISLAATALGVGGSVSSVQFFANGAPVGSPVVASPYVGSFVPTLPGRYVIEAIATDDRGNTTLSNAATVTAAFTSPSVAITSPLGTQVAPTRATPGVPLTLTATATGGSAATVLLVEFLVSGNVVGTRTTPTVANGSTYSLLWTPTTAQLGVAPITARVTDTNSLTSTSLPTYVSVVALTTPPPVITGVGVNPIPGLGLQTLSTANIVATVAPGNTSLNIASVEFFLTDGVNATRLGAGAREVPTANLYRLVYNFGAFDFSAITPNGAGAYPVQLFVIARDNSGVQTQSGLVNLTVNPSSSAPPTIQVQALGGTTIAQGNTFQLLALPTDTDGNVASIQLYSNGVPSGAAQLNPINGGVASFNFTPTVAGTFRLFASVTDDTGNTSISTVVTLTVTATAAPVVTLNLPTDNSTVTTVGAPTYLAATVTLADQTLTPTVQFTVRGSGGRNVPSITATRVGTTTTYRGIFTNTVADTYTIGLTASLAGGTISTTSPTTRTVQLNNASGNLPVITLTNFPGTTTTASTVSLTATATDGDGFIESVEFFLNRNSLGFGVREQLGNLWRIPTSFAGLTAGSYEVQAVARDNAGNAVATGISNLNLTTAASAAPTLSIAATPASVAFGRTVTLTATPQDSDGTINSVTYFSNGVAIPGGGLNGAGPTWSFTYTPSPTGTYNVYAIATDNTGNTAISQVLNVTVRPNNPLLDDTAFILQTATDIAAAAPNAVQLAAFEAQLASGALTRAQFAANLATGNGAFNNANFNQISNALAAYWLLMGEWPTTANYTTIFNNRGSLPNVVGAIIGSPEYLVKYGATPTVALLNNPNGVLPARTFLARLHTGAGLAGPSDLDVLRFMSNDTANVSLGIGRGYQPVGLNTAIAEFISIRNAGNAALIAAGRTAALYYQLNRPTVVTPQEAAATTNTVSTAAQVATRIVALMALPDLTAVADAALKDPLYSFRYVTITRQPEPLTIAPRSGAIFSVVAIGAPPIRYQWLQNGAPISGANSATLLLSNVNTPQAGNYSVVVTTSAGSVTSNPALLTLSTAPTRLGSISSRGLAGNGANVLTAGFAVTGTGTKQMLIRVIGPTLAGQGITGFLADPNLTLLNSAGAVVQTNEDWGTQVGGAAAVTAIQQATTRLRTFPLPANSRDAVVLATLNPGSYTVQARGAGNTTGVAIVEVYDASIALTGPKAIGVSTRTNVGSGENVLIAGFAVTGTVTRRVLIRGIGPTLRIFPGIATNSVLNDPQLTLFDATPQRRILATNDNWASGEDAAFIAAATAGAGVFPLANGSLDSAIIIMLPPGSYTAQLSGVGTTNNTGIGLIEVYDVDP